MNSSCQLPINSRSSRNQRSMDGEYTGYSARLTCNVMSDLNGSTGVYLSGSIRGRSNRRCIADVLVCTGAIATRVRGTRGARGCTAAATIGAAAFEPSWESINDGIPPATTIPKGIDTSHKHSQEGTQYNVTKGMGWVIQIAIKWISLYTTSSGGCGFK
jgi:hypothetical protein